MRWVLAVLAVVVIALVAVQIFLPRMAENDVEDRLTRDGGTAGVTIEAVPAVRLLFDDGDRIEVRAEEVEIPIEDIQGRSFKQLDGFDEVDVQLALSTVGPFFAEEVTIERGEGDDLYAFNFRGTTSAAQVGDFALSGLPLGGFALGIAGAIIGRITG